MNRAAILQALQEQVPNLLAVYAFGTQGTARVVVEGCAGVKGADLFFQQLEVPDGKQPDPLECSCQ